MKLSISWIFDHIIGSWKEHAVKDLVQIFNTKTAEIEHFRNVVIDLSCFTLARVTEIREKSIVLFSAELNKELMLEVRSDAYVGNLFIIEKKGSEFCWGKIFSWGSEKRGIVTSIFCSEYDVSGRWKDVFEAEDYILEIDNKSITNRPDLWGHRGVAREIGALLNLSLIPENRLLAQLPIKSYDFTAPATQEIPFSLVIKNPDTCSRFAGLYCSQVEYRESWLWMAARLVRIGGRPLNALVDTTNYVMFDWGQPLHAFDAQKIASNTIIVRMGFESDSLMLLDGQVIDITDQDIVITNGKKPLSLAGIMGGESTKVSSQTGSIFVESAYFDPATIRKSSLRFKKRTEASVRFEKNLDPLQNTQALLRFLKLLEKEKLACSVANYLISLGHEFEKHTIRVEHALIESRLGISLDRIDIERILIALEFRVTSTVINDSIVYDLVVPSWRATKDITIAEDIIEEVGRFIGYDTIPLVLPHIATKVSPISWVFQRRKIKDIIAYALSAHEVNNYALFDEVFLQKIGWEPKKVVSIQNPISLHWKKLVTSLIPQLCKNVLINPDADVIRFFEWNRTWQQCSNTVLEQKKCAGIFFDRKNEINFYKEKDGLSVLFDALSLPIIWQKAQGVLDPWYHPYQTAQLVHNDVVIGLAGASNSLFLRPWLEGDAFIFEIDAEVLLTFELQPQPFKDLPKYPYTTFDVSMFVPLTVTVQAVERIIQDTDQRIDQVFLIDFFEKNEWHDKRSITMRIVARDEEKTLTKEDIDHMYNQVLTVLRTLNAVIR